MLHLTNGQAIIPKIRDAHVRGTIVPWDDVLHEGPVPAGLNAAALRDRRAEFLAASGAGSHREIQEALERRDRALEDALVNPRRDEIVLWFEHDLYDQLHLIQILDRVPVDGGPPISIVPASTYLGQHEASEFPALFGSRRPVTSAERIAARDAWAAFRSADPRAMVEVLPRVTVLPHLGAALGRHLEQFPSLRDGLSRTEHAALQAVDNGITRLGDVFAETQRQEEAMFMGDAGFLFHIAAMIRSHRPLLAPDREPFVPSDPRALDRRVSMTSLGRSVLAGESDRVALCAIDRWLGGVHLHGHGPVWRWDAARQAIKSA